MMMTPKLAMLLFHASPWMLWSRIEPGFEIEAQGYWPLSGDTCLVRGLVRTS